MSTDAEHLRWIAGRLDNVHGDPPQADFIQRLRQIADRLDADGAGLARQFMDAIVAERHRAHAKHGATSMEQSPLLSHRRASILAEEAVECGKALNDNEHGDVDLAPGIIPPGWASKYDELDKELIQTAAMAYTWWANRRGHRLDPPQPAPERPTIPVLINGVPYTGVLDPATGTLHVHTIDGPFGKALHDAEAGDTVRVTMVPDSALNEHVGGAWTFTKRERPEPPADASWLRFEDTRGRPYPPITEPDGGRRGD